MSDDDTLLRFERLVLPHLDAAYNLARWLTRNEHDAEDVVQESCLRALRYFGGFRGEQARPWLLQTVRHTCYSWLSENRPAEIVSIDDDEDDADGRREGTAPAEEQPEALLLQRADRARVNEALAALPIALREVLVLREMEDLSYKDIARIAGIPIGTVMSRLSRSRAALREALAAPLRPALRSVAGTRHGSGA